MSKSDPSRAQQVCVICGVEPATTVDHIPPKAVYTKVERQTAKYRMHTVPACWNCNNKDKVNDEQMKVFLGLTTSKRGADQKDIIKSVVSTVINNNRLAKDIFSSACLVYANTSPYILEQQVQVSFDRLPYIQSIRRMARAMYWRMTGNILFSVKEIEIAEEGVTVDMILPAYRDSEIKDSNHSVNDGTLKSRLIRYKDMEIIELTFFDKHVAVAMI